MPLRNLLAAAGSTKRAKILPLRFHQMSVGAARRTLTCLVSVILNYSSNEKASIEAVLSQSLKFSDDIVVSYGSHLLDGSPEDMQHIQQLSYKFPKVRFSQYEVNLALDLSSKPGVVARPTAYWHNLARWTGVQHLKCREWVFIYDADEVPNGDLVRNWLHDALPRLQTDSCYKIASHWYFKKPTFQATTMEEAALLIHKSLLTKETIFGDWERTHIIEASHCTLHGNIKDFNGLVLWHHYSWVRSRDRLEHKLRHWAHADDIYAGADVTEMMETIFRDDNVNDIVHNYDYVTVNNTFDIQI